MMRQIRAINKTLNDLLQNEDITRSVTWKLKTFEFSNMFSYGDGNSINFTKAKDVVGMQYLILCVFVYLIDVVEVS